MLNLDLAEKDITNALSDSKHLEFAEVKDALQAIVMIELIKLLRAENANRQENGRTSDAS